MNFDTKNDNTQSLIMETNSLTTISLSYQRSHIGICVVCTSVSHALSMALAKRLNILEIIFSLYYNDTVYIFIT